MTENEAIIIFENPTKHITKLLLDDEETICYSSDMAKAFETAIQALSEIQQYKAIGTVEKLSKLKELYDKAKWLLDDERKKRRSYEAIGTIEEFKALKEKNEPKELAEHNFQDEVHHYLCPSCRSIVSCNQNYCDECGQALET